MALVYDPRGHTWDSWCPLIAELFAKYGLGTAPEEMWKAWASAMLGVGNFASSGVPDPRGFDDWQDWAKQFVGVMNVNV
jgi:hypothetical protein